MTTIARTFIIAALGLATAACATSEEWAEWKGHTGWWGKPITVQQSAILEN
jgi:hypothetical protein